MLCVDLLVGDLGRLDRDPQALVAADRDLGPDLDDGVEDDVALVLAGGDVDLGRGDDVDVVLGDGLRVVLGQRVLEGLGPGRLGAEPGLEELRGALPGRNPGMRTSRAMRLKAASTSLLELGLVDLDRDLDLVALEGLDGGLHGAAECRGCRATDPVMRSAATRPVRQGVAGRAD